MEPINQDYETADVSPFIPFSSFVAATPVLPTFYWDVYSAEERWKTICKLMKKLTDYIEYMGEAVNVDREKYNELILLFQQFQESGFEDYYEAQLQAWIEANAGELLTQYIKLVFFGLTQDGYFCAWIPESWSEITFDTVADYSDPLYGRLVLLYDAEGNFELNYGTGDGVTVADYETLSNKPSINGVTLIGNNTFEQLGLNPVTSADIHNIVGGG